MSNPLLGNRISLISKKNIRYEGTLYSINEADATVALQNVKSYGTEGREKTEEACTFVPPQDAVHPYLLFRGCDIKDLHVHEQPKPATAEDVPVKTQESTPPAETSPPKKVSPPPKQQPKEAKKEPKKTTKQQRQKQSNKQKQAQVGTGASLLNRKERGTVDGGLEISKADFDIQSNLANFEKEDEESSDEEQPDTSAYAKDDFFDSISCDAIDKRDGIDNRLRGSAERTLNTETFGAASLNSQRRRRYGGRGGRGRGRGGRGGRGRGGSGPRQQNNRWQKGSGSSSSRQQRGSAQTAS